MLAGCLSIVGSSGFVWHMVAPGSCAVHFGVRKYKYKTTQIQKYTNMNCLEYIWLQPRHSLCLHTYKKHIQPFSEAHMLHCIGTTMCLKCGHRWWCKERLFTMETWLRHPDWQGHWPLSGETYVLFATNSAQMPACCDKFFKLKWMDLEGVFIRGRSVFFKWSGLLDGQ